jgi:cob(I)alamin adenosyltransferase
MKLYTKQGDDGRTGLIGGRRVFKHDGRVACYGDVDETNAALGVVIASGMDKQTNARLQQIQGELFVLGGELATPTDEKPPTSITQAHAMNLERWIDEACDETPPLRQFVLPGGSITAAQLHFARTVCRRAERSVVALAQQETISPWPVIYLNRLSDYLFALARLSNARSGVEDIPWTAPPSASDR